MAGRPAGSQNKDKPYRDALRMEAAALANGDRRPHPPGSLRAIAQARLMTACMADGSADAKEIADRLDGRVPQAIGGSDELPPIHGVAWLDQTASSASTTCPESSSSRSTSDNSASPASSPTGAPEKP